MAQGGNLSVSGKKIISNLPIYQLCHLLSSLWHVKFSCPYVKMQSNVPTATSRSKREVINLPNRTRLIQ